MSRFTLFYRQKKKKTLIIRLHQSKRANKEEENGGKKKIIHTHRNNYSNIGHWTGYTIENETSKNINYTLR